MGPAGQLHDGEFPSEQRFDIGEVFPNRDLVALPFVAFIPLIVVVEDQRDEIIESLDEAVGRRGVDEAVEAAVKIREIVIAAIDLVQQGHMFIP